MDGTGFYDGHCMSREGLHFEAKEAREGIPRDAWETYSAFANTDGGTIVFGLRKEEGALKVVGVPDAEERMQDIWNRLDNPEHVSCNLLRSDDLSTSVVDGCKLIVMRVPHACREDRPVHLNANTRNSFRRNGEGDYRCTYDEVAQMVSDSISGPTDRFAVDDLEIGDLASGTIKAYRNSLRTLKPEHPWNGMDDDEFLRLIGAATRMDGRYVPTMAGVLMFGYDCSIADVAYQYRVDYRAYADEGNEWYDRLVSGSGDWTGNVYDFYRNVMVRTGVYVGRPMAIGKDMKRVEDTELDKCMREAVLNAIVNADYRGRGGISVELRPESFTVRNPGPFRIPPEMAREGRISDPRNQTLAKMFSLIGDSERAGSGVRRIFDSCRRIGLKEPVIEETITPMSVVLRMDLRKGSGHEDELRSDIIRILSDDGGTSMDSISQTTGASRSKVQRTLDSLKSEGVIERMGGTRGRWVVRRSTPLIRYAYDR